MIIVTQGESFLTVTATAQHIEWLRSLLPKPTHIDVLVDTTFREPAPVVTPATPLIAAEGTEFGWVAPIPPEPDIAGGNHHPRSPEQIASSNTRS